MLRSSVWPRIRPKLRPAPGMVALAFLLPTASSCAARRPPSSQGQAPVFTDYSVQLEHTTPHADRVDSYWTADVPEQFVVDLIGADGPGACRDKIEAGAMSCMTRFDNAQIRARKSGEKIIWYLTFDAQQPPFSQRTWHFGTASGEPPGMVGVKELH